MTTFTHDDIPTIRDAIARTLYLCDYADGVEDGRIQGDAAGPGDNWDDVAPAGSTHAAGSLAQSIVNQVGAGALLGLAAQWCDASGLDLERFGHCVAMECLGHGVGLDDDIPADVTIDRNLPYVEGHGVAERDDDEPDEDDEPDPDDDEDDEPAEDDDPTDDEDYVPEDDEEARELALARFLGVSLEDVSHQYDNTFSVGRRRVKRGTSPEKAKRLVAATRACLQTALSWALDDRTGIRLMDPTKVMVGAAGPGDYLCPESLPAEASAITRDVLVAAVDVLKQCGGKLREGDLLPTYDTLVAMMRACPDCAAGLSAGIHDVANTLYFVSPGTDGNDHAAAHRDTIREAWDGTEPTDRRTTEWTDDGEWLVVTDDEADEAWDEQLDNYLDECVLPDLPETARHYFDREQWKADARHDGRGHCLSSYDGSECEQVSPDEFGDDVTWCLFRIN